MFSQPPELECYTAFSWVGLHIAINNTLPWSMNSSHASYCLFEIRKIAACFLWLSLPGHYRVTDEALLAETT